MLWGGTRPQKQGEALEPLVTRRESLRSSAEHIREPTVCAVCQCLQAATKAVLAAADHESGQDSRKKRSHRKNQVGFPHCNLRVLIICRVKHLVPRHRCVSLKYAVFQPIGQVQCLTHMADKWHNCACGCWSCAEPSISIRGCLHAFFDSADGHGKTHFDMYTSTPV